MLNLVAAFITLTTLLTYVSYRFIRIPPTIGVMVMALLFSLVIQGLDMVGLGVVKLEVKELVQDIDFSGVLMTWFLPALLFAGALHVNLVDLRNHKWSIGLLATVGVLVSMVAVAGLTYYICEMFGWHVNFIYCLLFGALISPTDPIAVMGILKSAGAPKPLSTTIVGESLFNDGTAIVVFTILLGMLHLDQAPTAMDMAGLFAKEALGAILLGALLGYLVMLMMRGINQYQVEVMLTLALVIGGSALAAYLHVSSPITMVVAGLVVGNFGRKYVMSDETRGYLDKFWELIDEMLNALLFALIGLELLLVPFSWLHIFAGLVLGLVVLLARSLTIAPGVTLLRRTVAGRKQMSKGSTRILVWGGLRGGVSLALALSLPIGEERNVLLSLTYVVVVSSILLQGLSIGPLIKRIYARQKH